jgi:hypothetical protein
VAGPGKTIIFSPGEYGENLSRLDVTYNVFSKKIVCFKYKSIPVDDRIPGDPATQAMVEAYHAAINASIAPYTLAGPISKTDFALELAALTETGLGNLAADSLRATATGLAMMTGGDPCDFSVVASGVIRDNLYPGSTGYITFADAYNVLPLGISPDTTQGVPGYPLMSLYVTAPDLRNICEAALTVAPGIGSDYYLNFSGLSVEFDPDMAPYYQGVRSVSLYPVNDIPCMNDAGLVPIIDLDAPYVSTGLYHCVVDLYALQMMNVVTDMGLTIIPRDEFGVEIDPADYMSFRIDARPDLAGTQELKEWMPGGETLPAFSRAHEVGHGCGQGENDLHESRVDAVAVPGALVDELLLPVLLDGVDVLLPVVHEELQPGPGGLGVAVQQVAAQEIESALLLEHVRRPFVHLDDDALDIAHRDRCGELLDPCVGIHGYFFTWCAW